MTRPIEQKDLRPGAWLQVKKCPADQYFIQMGRQTIRITNGMKIQLQECKSTEGTKLGLNIWRAKCEGMRIEIYEWKLLAWFRRDGSAPKEEG